jgi:hippurate hydrolase
MIHVITPTTYDTGTFIISDDEVTAASCDYFQIKVIGKSVHGAMPSLGVDPIIIGSNIVISLKHIETNEIHTKESYTLTFGTICGGNTFNVIPDEVLLKGTLRTFDEEVRIYAKNRIVEISNYIAKAYNGRVELSFPTSTPVLINNLKLVTNISNVLKNNNINVIKTSELDNKSKVSGSEDFAYISQKVPSVMLNLCAGNINNGYKYPLHNSKVIFDENSIYHGILAFLTILIK